MYALTILLGLLCVGITRYVEKLLIAHKSNGFIILSVFCSYTCCLSIPKYQFHVCNDTVPATWQTYLHFHKMFVR